MVPAVAEWRYLERGPTLPWYPTLQLYRQEQRGKWGDVIAALAARLRRETEVYPSSGSARC